MTPDRTGTAGAGRSVLRLAGPVLVLLAGLLLLNHLWRTHQGLVRGTEQGLQTPLPLRSQSLYGVNVALEQYPPARRNRALSLVQGAGFGMVRQRFPWAAIEAQPGRPDWQPWDEIVDAVDRGGLELLAVVDTSPAWARRPEDGDHPQAPPGDPDDLARFVDAFVGRYGERLAAVQIWDEPNLYPHWGERSVDPQGYARLLAASYTAVKARRPDLPVLAAGLAPNTEPGGRNMSDVAYLRRLYEAGLAEFSDGVATKAYGFWTGPEDRRLHPRVLNFSRAVLLREEMIRAGDARTGLWIVEMGWNVPPPGYDGPPPPWGADAEALQAQRLGRALERAALEWPWLSHLAVSHLQPDVPADDPQRGFALLTPQLEPRLSYQVVRERLTGWVAPVGRYAVSPRFLELGPAWAPLQDGLVRRAEGEPGSFSLDFLGSRIGLLVVTRVEEAQLQVDGLAVRPQSRPAGGRGAVWITVAAGSSGPHRLQGTFPGGTVWLEWRVESQRSLWGLRLGLGLAALLTAAAVWTTGRRLARLSWSSWLGQAVARIRVRPEGDVLLAGAGLALVYQLAPSLAAAGLALGALLLLFYARLSTAPPLVLLAAPFYLHPRPVGRLEFSLVETLVVAAALAWAARVLWPRGEGPTWGDPARAGWRRPAAYLRDMVAGWTGADWAALALAGAALLSLVWTSYLRVALRELRVVVLEPLLFYLLLRQLRPSPGRALGLAGVWLASGAMLSLVGLYQLAAGEDLITAEGVVRIRAVFGSPNNLALYLGRMLPFLWLAALVGAPGPRRRVYVGLLVLTGLALVLTFSRAALLVGVPVAVLGVTWLAGRRRAWLAAMAVLALALAALPLLGLERISGLADVGQGTTLLRLKLWQASLEMLGDHLLTGVGLDNFLYHYPDYIRPEALAEPDLSHPHNVVLDFWLRLGLPGLAVLAALLWSFFPRALGAWRALPRWPSLLALGLVGAMLDVLAHGLLDAAFFTVDLAVSFWLIYGLGVSLGEAAPAPGDPRGRPVQSPP